MKSHERLQISSKRYDLSWRVSSVNYLLPRKHISVDFKALYIPLSREASTNKSAKLTIITTNSKEHKKDVTAYVNNNKSQSAEGSKDTLTKEYVSLEAN